MSSGWLPPYRCPIPQGGNSGGGSNNTVTQTQQIPPYEQQFSANNQALAQQLGQNPYPQYQGQLVAGMTPAQTQAMNAVPGIAGSYLPGLNAAQGLTGASVQGGEAGLGGAAGMVGNALGQSANQPGVVGSYMNPFVQEALQPQIQNLQTQLGQEQQGINAQATQAGAFGDARQGVESSLANLYGNQALSGLVGQGYDTAYQQAVQAAQQQQQMGLSGAGTLAGIASAGGQLGLAGASQGANLAGLQQSLGLTGANALYNTGQLQQQLQQQQLNTAYQQFMNQSLWPYQMLNVQESALSNSPYNISSLTTLPNANMVSQGLGAFTGAAGALGSLFGGGGGGGGGPTAPAPLGA